MIVKLLLDHGGININDTGSTLCPLSIAAEEGHDDIVALLLSCENIEPDNKDQQGRTPLWIATLKGRTGVVKQLLDFGDVDVNVNVKTSLRSKYCSPLVNAVDKGSTAIVKLLLDHGEVDVNASGSTFCPLSIAADKGYEDIVALLLSCENIEPDKKDKHGLTPLIHAAKFGRARIVEKLLNHGGIDVNHNADHGYFNSDGGTALGYALNSKHHHIVQTLSTCENLEVDRMLFSGFTAFKLIYHIDFEDMHSSLPERLAFSSTWAKMKKMARIKWKNHERVMELYETLSKSDVSTGEGGQLVIG